MTDSQRDQTGEGIERLRHELEAEFEEFVSMTVHNLGEPLRDVASYSQLIADTYAGGLDSDAGLFLDRIQEGAAKMQSLLADVVDYWAASASGEAAVPTDMEAVLRQALLLADRQITGRSATVTHDALPMVCGDFAILTKVLNHLIRNAIEYGAAMSPQVHISARREDLDWVLSVQDNGPGIEAAFQDRLFVPFKRLHGREFPGNGLGLAFCKKAIEGLGGRIWMESAPGAGATFHFALPAAS